MERCAVKPYKGNENYIFISYSHMDKRLVFPVIERLARDGYRVWYDEGIEPGSEWPEIIAQHLDGCCICLGFITDNYLASQNCKRELTFALQRKKAFVSVFLEEVELSLGMEMQLSVAQSVFKHKLPEEELFYAKLYEMELLEQCRGEGKITAGECETKIIEPIPEPIKQKTAPVKKKHEKKTMKWYQIAWIGIPVAMIALAVLFLGNRDKGPEIPQFTEISDDWTECMFELDGVIYQLPASYQAFAANGWTVAVGHEENEKLGGYSRLTCELVKDGRKVTVVIFNTGGHVSEISLCSIAGIEVDSTAGVVFNLMQGINHYSKIEEIKTKLGAPNQNSSSKLVYLEGSSKNISFEFSKSQKCERIRLQCFETSASEKTKVSRKRPDYLTEYIRPVQIAENIEDMTFELDGKLYKLPCPMSEFTKNGWKIESPDMQSLGAWNVDSSMKIKLTKGKQSFYVSVMNNGDKEVYLENCAVCGVRFRGSLLERAEVGYLTLPGEMHFGTSPERIEELCGNFAVFGSASTYAKYTYTDENSKRKVLFEISGNELQTIELINENWKH